MMKLFTILIVLQNIVLIIFLVSPCVISHKILVQTLHDEQVVHPTLPALISRKLKLHDDSNVKNIGNKQYYMPFNRKEEALLHAGKLHHKEEGSEGIEASQFFIMDYHPVTKRHPIHNTFVPVAP